ncbi:hypothetical protein P8452_65264 [Trifolium repens]|nr:hypothetical protein P8452_65264 [Trifolium repens]
MATTTITFIKLLSFVFVAIVVLENSHVVSSTTTTEPTIPASPEASAPSPSSGEFDGKKSSSSRLEYCIAAAIVGIMFSIVSF